MSVKSKVQLASDIAASTFTAPQQVILDDMVDSYEDIFSQLTTVQRNLLTPTLGLMIYNTDTDLYEYWNGVTWLGVGNSLSQLSIKVNLSSAELLALNTTAKVLVAAQGAGYSIAPISLLYRYTYATTEYDFDSDSIFICKGTSPAYVNSFFKIPTIDINNSSTCSGIADKVSGGAPSQKVVENDSIKLSCSANPTQGDGTLTVWLNYSIIAW